MKLFKTGNVDVVKDCQSCFAIDLTSCVLKSCVFVLLPFFSVNRDLYNIQVSTVADGPARRADCCIVLCNKLAKVAGRTPTVASIVNLSSTDEGRWFITLSDHLCRTKLAVRHLHYAEKDNTGCYKTNVSCSCFMSVAFILCNGISQEQSSGWIKTKKTHVAV